MSKPDLRTDAEIQWDIAQFIHKASFTKGGYGVTGQPAIARGVGIPCSRVSFHMPRVRQLVPKIWPGHSLDEERTARGFLYRVRTVTTAGCVEQMQIDCATIETKYRGMSTQAASRDNGPLLKEMANVFKREADNAISFRTILKEIEKTLL